MGGLSNIPVFIISLDRAVERREYMKVLLSNIGVEATFISAVDGRRLSDEQRSAYNPELARRFYGCEMSASEIACYLSHYGIYKRIVDEGIETALIVEDDIDCVGDLRAIIEELGRLSIGGWQVVRLMASKSSVQRPRDARAYGAPLGKVAGRDLCQLQNAVLGGCAYVIRKSAAQTMLNYARTIFMPIDQALDRYWENGIVPFVLRPLPVWHSPIFDSEIGARGRALEPQPSRMTVLRRRLQRYADGLNKRAFWLAFHARLTGQVLSLIGLSAAKRGRAAAALMPRPASAPLAQAMSPSMAAAMAIPAE
jgi:glycosyl transferase, family 25